MDSPLFHRDGSTFYRFQVKGISIIVNERILNRASNIMDTSNPAYRMVKKVLGLSHRNCVKFLVGYRLFVQGYKASSDALYFCSLLDS